MAHQPIRILVTGAGSPGFAGVVKSLRAAKDMAFHILGADANADAFGFRLADASAVVPFAADPDYIPAMLELCRRHRIRLVYSLVTAELEPLSRHVEAFRSAGALLSPSRTEAIRDSIRKDRLFHRLRAAGLEVPEFRMVSSASGLMAAIHALGYPSRPICFKPVVADGSRGFHVLDASVDRVDLIFRRKPGSAHLSERELADVLAAHPKLPEVLVMEYLPREEYSVDAFAVDGRTLVAVPRLREKIVDGITAAGRTVPDPDVMAYAEQVIRVMGLNGIVGVQIRRDAAGKPKIVEVNPRIQGTMVHTTAAGVNLPLIGVKHALGMPIGEDELRIAWGTRMIRHWEEAYERADGSAYAF